MGSPRPTLTLGVGDMVVVTIFEAASGGLFSGERPSVVGASKSVSLPPQPISRNGTVSVPYVGQVQARQGSTTAEVERAIEAALKDKAIEPQVVVTVARVPVDFRDHRRRCPKSWTAAAQSWRRPPARCDCNGGWCEGRGLQYVRQADVGESERDGQPRPDRTRPAARTSICGRNDLRLCATPMRRLTPPSAPRRRNGTHSVHDRPPDPGAGRGRGWRPQRRAEQIARGVFVFRYEDPEVYSLAHECRSGDRGISGGHRRAGVPVVYKLDMKDPVGFFAAQRFLMREQRRALRLDAASVELQKLFGVFNGERRKRQFRRCSETRLGSHETALAGLADLRGAAAAEEAKIGRTERGGRSRP